MLERPGGRQGDGPERKSELCKRCGVLWCVPCYNYCTFCLDVIILEWEGWQRGGYHEPAAVSASEFMTSDGQPVTVLPFAPRPKR
jgi:hypothetical protein